jgi:hypothetical protein
MNGRKLCKVLQDRWDDKTDLAIQEKLWIEFWVISM